MAQGRTGALLWVLRRTAAVARREGVRGTVQRIVKHARLALGISAADVRAYKAAKAAADRAYDRQLGVDTGGTQNLGGLTIQSPNAALGVAHIATVPAHFHRAMSLLDIAPDGITFIDLGSGKGRALLMAADYSFAAISGVEFAEELHAICRANITRFGDPRITCTLGDAEVYAYPSGDLVVYMNNPFDAALMKRIACRLSNLQQEAPRAIRVVYANPTAPQAFAQAPWFTVATAPGVAVFGPAA